MSLVPKIKSTLLKPAAPVGKAGKFQVGAAVKTGKAWGGAAAWSAAVSWNAVPAWGKTSKGSAKGNVAVGKGPFGKSDVKGGKKGKKGGKAPGNLANDDQYWTDKVSAENRIESDGLVFTGKIVGFNIKHGWGFIAPDDPESLPEDARSLLTQAAEKQKAKGKTVENDYLLYFRKPDVVEGFTPAKDAAVLFQIYTDDKGAGATQVSGAD